MIALLIASLLALSGSVAFFLAARVHNVQAAQRAAEIEAYWEVTTDADDALIDALHHQLFDGRTPTGNGRHRL